MRTALCTITAFFITACGTGFINKPILDTGEESAEPEGTDTPDDGGEPDPPPPPPDTGEPDDTEEPEPVTISPAHPRLFFSPSDIPRLQAQVFDFERAELINKWDATVSEWRSEDELPFSESAPIPTTNDAWSSMAGPLPNLAMYALFTEDEEVHTQTVVWMQRIADQAEWGTEDEPNMGRGASQMLQAMAIAYDMLHDNFEVEERIAFRRALIQQAGKLYRGLTGDTPPSWAQQWNNRDAQTAHAALLMAGLATEHDYADSALWLEHSRSFIETSMLNLEEIEDGTWSEGPSIASDTLTSLFQSLYLIERHFGENWSEHPWLQNRSDAMLRASMPGQANVFTVGDGTQGWLRGPEHQACFADIYSPLPVALWLADQHRILEDTSSRRYELWLEFLWCDPAVEGAAPGPAMSPSHWFRQWGTGVWSSGFSATDSSLLFHAGLPADSDDWSDSSAVSTYDIRTLHPAVGSFAWTPNGQPVITTGSTQRPKRTALASTYTFSASESADRGWGASERSDWWSPDTFHDNVGDLSRVGQRGEWGFDYGPANEFVGAYAGMDLVETKRGVTVMIGHYGGMYPVEYHGESGWWDLGINRMTRTIVILPQHIVLIFDHLEHSTDLLHHARFQSTTGSFSVGGTSGTISTPDGNTWAIDVPGGGGLSTGSHIQRVDEPDGTWINHMEITNSAAAGKHNHLYILRSNAQTVATTWTPTDEGVTAELSVASEGTAETYSIRVANSSDPIERQAFLAFSGWVGVQPGTETEIRF